MHQPNLLQESCRGYFLLLSLLWALLFWWVWLILHLMGILCNKLMMHQKKWMGQMVGSSCVKISWYVKITGLLGRKGFLQFLKIFVNVSFSFRLLFFFNWFLFASPCPYIWNCPVNFTQLRPKILYFIAFFKGVYVLMQRQSEKNLYGESKQNAIIRIESSGNVRVICLCCRKCGILTRTGLFNHI